MERFREAATQVFSTGSFWCAAVPMAAAVATLTALRRDVGPGRMARTGQMLRDGLAAGAKRHGIGIVQTGPVQMPLLQFEGDVGYAMGDRFCSAALREGVYFHPKHNMFLSVAHGEAEIAQALAAADVGFRAVARG